MDEVHEVAHDVRARVDVRDALGEFHGRIALLALAHADRHERHVRCHELAAAPQKLAVGVEARRWRISAHDELFFRVRREQEAARDAAHEIHGLRVERRHADLQAVGRVENLLRVAVGNLHALAFEEIAGKMEAAVALRRLRQARERDAVAMEEQRERQHFRQNVLVHREAEVRLVDFDGRTVVDGLHGERVFHARDRHDASERLPAEARIDGDVEVRAGEHDGQHAVTAGRVAAENRRRPYTATNERRACIVFCSLSTS